MHAEAQKKAHGGRKAADERGQKGTLKPAVVHLLELRTVKRAAWLTVHLV